MQNRLKKLALSAAFTAAVFAQNLQADTLQQIFDLAVTNDPQIRAAEAQLKADMENRGLGRAGILPQISLSGSYQDESDGFNNFGGAASSDTETTTYSANLTQALFDLPAWYNYKRGDALANQAEQDYLVAKQNLIIRVATAYFNVLRALDNMDATKAEEVALAKQLEQTKQRYEVGLIAITDVHEAQAAYDAVVARLVDDLGLVGITFENLTVLTGQAHNSIAPVKQDFPIVPPDPIDVESWVEMALENSYALESAKLARDASKYNADSRKWEHAPSLSLGLAYNDLSIETTQGISQTELNTETETISLSLNVPIYLGGSISAGRRQANYQYIASEESLNNTRLTLIQNTRNQHLIVRIDVAEVEARRQSIISAESAYEATLAGYEVGTRNLVDVLNAEQGLYQSRRDFYQSRYDYIIDRFTLEELVGSLNSEDISAVDGWLDASALIPRNIVENALPGMPAPNRSSSASPSANNPAVQGISTTSTTTALPSQATVDLASLGPVESLELWAADWSALNIEAYLGHYSASFKPRTQAGTNWRDARRERLETLNNISVNLSNVQILEQDSNSALVTFDQSYSSDLYSDITEKEIGLVREDDRWKIASERALNIIPR